MIADSSQLKVSAFGRARPHTPHHTGAHNCAAEGPMWADQNAMGEGWIGSGGASGTRTPDLRIMIPSL